jgi:O-antigen ligase
MTTTTLTAPPLRSTWTDKLETLTAATALLFVAASQLSVAAAQILLAGTLACWVALVAARHERVGIPAVFWPLGAYAVVTVVSALASSNLLHSLLDCKQLLLFLIVPFVYRIARGDRAHLAANVIITVGALNAVLGIVQYSILEYDNLGRRPEGSLTHYMTYSGVLMLVAGTVTARLLYETRDRAWPALVLPAVLVALALTFTRSAWVGVFVALGLLLVLRDRRLLALLPITVALFIAIAPASVTARVYSMFDVRDPSNRDRVAMLTSGTLMVRDYPLTGVGPDMVKIYYPRYRQPEAEHAVNPHLHNVPMQIAVERGLPALAIWTWFVVALSRDLLRRFYAGRHRALAAGGLAAIASMLAAGLFEYNFGDSEFLMLFLVLVTLPYAADRRPAERPL